MEFGCIWNQRNAKPIEISDKILKTSLHTYIQVMNLQVWWQYRSHHTAKQLTFPENFKDLNWRLLKEIFVWQAEWLPLWRQRLTSRHHDVMSVRISGPCLTLDHFCCDMQLQVVRLGRSERQTVQILSAGQCWALVRPQSPPRPPRSPISSRIQYLTMTE